MEGQVVLGHAESDGGSETRGGGEAELHEPAPDELIVEDLLVEDVSIDGMCGVY